MLNRLNWVAACAAAVVLVGCGGGGGDNQTAGYTVDSGAAQKGPLAQGSAVFVNELSAATLQPNGKEYTFRTSNSLGAFSTAGITFGSSYLSTMAWGYYFDEITGKQSADVVALAGLSQLGIGGDTVINVNALSSMAVNRITKLATQASPLTFAAARAQAQKDVLGAFYIYNGTSILTGTSVNNVGQPANLTALDLGKNRAGDQMLAAVSGLVMAAGANGNGVNTLLSQIAVDLGDDGLLNNSPNYTRGVSTQLCAAADVTDFAAVANNLNKLYGTKYTATDLSQWVDSSGCVDQVIDKYKFTATNVKTSTASKSPAYVAGPDDVGQCFSAGNATSGASAKLYFKGSTTGVIGTQKVALGDSMTIGISAARDGSFAAFIRRSAPDSTGACPTTVPASGLVRVQKYTIVTTPTYAVGGTVNGLAAGQSVTVLNNGGNARTVSVNGAFTFTTALATGAAYAVTVGTQPGGMTCIVSNGNGTIDTMNVNVSIQCGEREPTSYVVSTMAGNEIYGAGDGGEKNSPARPGGVAVDAAGNVYVANTSHNKIRKISAEGVVSTLAGSGEQGNTDGAGASASFDAPTGVAVDGVGNVYVADKRNHKIRKITAGGVVSTLAGTGVPGSADGVSTTATLYYLVGISVDSSGNVYVAEPYAIRKISKAGFVSTLAGSGGVGFEDGPGTMASFYFLTGVAADAAGNVYVAEPEAHRIRKISSVGLVSTLAGTAQNQGNKDGAATSATFAYPNSVAVDTAGNIYVSDEGNQRIRKISAAGVVSTLPVGVRSCGIAVDAARNLYVASCDKKILKLTPQF